MTRVDITGPSQWDGLAYGSPDGFDDPYEASSPGYYAPERPPLALNAQGYGTIVAGMQRRALLVGSIFDAIGDVASSVVSDVGNVIGGIPLVGDALAWAGGQFKDFANTAFGGIVLRAFSTMTYGALAPVLGPQLAAVAFAIPGVAKGDAFQKAWLEEFVWRLEKTAEVAGADVAKEAAAQVGPATDKLVQMAKDQGIAVEALAAKLQGMNLQQLAQSLGVREDIAQTVLDLIAKQNSFGLPPLSEAAKQAMLMLGIAAPTLPRDGKYFDPSTGKQIFAGAAGAMSVAQATAATAAQARAGKLQAATAPLPARKIVVQLAAGHGGTTAFVAAVLGNAKAGSPPAQQTIAALARAKQLLDRDGWVAHYLRGAPIPGTPGTPGGAPALPSPRLPPGASPLPPSFVAQAMKQAPAAARAPAPARAATAMVRH